MKRTSITGALVCAAFLSLAGTAAADTMTVTPGDVNQPGGDWYTADSRPPGTGTFESGPATPPLGAGSFELSTPGTTAKVQLFTDRYDGTRLADIDGIGYSTYRDPASTGFIAGVAALNMRIDLTGDGNPDAYMVYEPYQDQGNAAVHTGEWQNWDAYRGGAATWWINTSAGGCGQSTPCSFSTITTLFPNATIEEGTSCGPGNVVTPCPGSLGLNQGSFNPDIVSNADALYVSVNGAQTTYDLEPALTPASRDDCKDGGWMTFNSPAFKNQGDCVSWFAPGQAKKR